MKSGRATLKDAQARLAAGDAKAAAKAFEELAAAAPGDPLILRLLARALAEDGRAPEAIVAARRIAACGAARRTVALLAEAEVHIAAGHPHEALATLEPAPGENIIVRGLRAVLGFECGPPDAPPGLQALDPAAFWFEPVLTALLLLLESRLRAAEATRSRETHAARSALFAPLFAPSPRLGLFERLSLVFKSPARRALARREADMWAHFARGDLAAALEGLEAWLAAEPEAYAEPSDKAAAAPALDPRLTLVLEILFNQARFAELLQRGQTIGPKLLEDAPELRRLLAYAAIAEGKAERARTLLGAASASDDAAQAHLRALVELALQRRERAAGWLRRATERDDIAMVELAKVEMAALGLNGKPVRA